MNNIYVNFALSYFSLPYFYVNIPSVHYSLADDMVILLFLQLVYYNIHFFPFFVVLHVWRPLFVFFLYLSSTQVF